MDDCAFQDVQTDSLGLIRRTISNNTISKVYIKDLLVKEMCHKERIETITCHEVHSSCSNLNGLGPSRAHTGIEQPGWKVHKVWDHALPRTRRKSRHVCFLGHSKGENSSLGVSQCRSVRGALTQPSGSVRQNPTDSGSPAWRGCPPRWYMLDKWD